MSSESNLEELVLILEASQEYRILRRIDPKKILHPKDQSPTKLALLVDVETTGLNPARDEIIELAMVPFHYTQDGRIFEILEPFQQFHEPKTPIREEITALTGITNEMVKGHKIDGEDVARFVKAADLIIAHNAGFDRRFLERLSPVFVEKHWGCSMTQIPWAQEGFEGTKLGYLTTQSGFFHNGHRATDDCIAAISILAQPLAGSKTTAMAQLLSNARKPTWRIWAENAPFDFKDHLKARGYRWNGEVNGNPRAWYIDVEDDHLGEELSFLEKQIYQRQINLNKKKITAAERFSIRA